MEEKKINKKQEVLINIFKFRQFFINIFNFSVVYIKKFLDSILPYILLLSIIIFIIIKLNITITDEEIKAFSLTICGIIGASIAIIFSFSTFVLQSTAELFSTEYLKKFILDYKEKLFFWLLVILTILSFVLPFILTSYKLESLIAIIFLSFYLIYSLYKQLRERIDPESTLRKIKAISLKELKKINKIFKRQANIQNFIFKYDGENKDFSVDLQYKINPTWNFPILINIKYLYEIGLRLLSKNEINSFNIMLQFLNDIYIQHLALRNKYFIRELASIFGTYTFDDQKFTIKVLEYLESISNRLIQENRKENIYFLLKIYESILQNSLYIEYADKKLGANSENPIFSLILSYYEIFINKIISSKNNDWIWESIKSSSNISNFILHKTDNYFIYSQINKIINNLLIPCLEKNNESCLKEIVRIFFNQIRISWNKYEDNEIFWQDLFKELKKSILALSISSNLNISVADIFINFHQWMTDSINSINSLNDEKIKKGNIDKFVTLLERWSDFILDFSREVGLENNWIGLQIIQSVDNNLRIIYFINGKFPEINLSDLYKTQFSVLSWYFKNIDTTDKEFLLNLEEVLQIILVEIKSNLEEKVFDIDLDDLIEDYIRLIEKHFNIVEFGYGYSHPRIIEKLVCLGLILNKHKSDKENIVVLKINELNGKYLVLLEQNSIMKDSMGPDENQLNKEICDLENDLFSYSRPVMTDLKGIIREDISKENWDDFISKLECFKDDNDESLKNTNTNQ